ncbi:MAG TPA: hypothetical protein VGI93_15195 [Steroidobacteraceae bacterium]
MLDVLLAFVFTFHLLLVDVALAGPFFAVWLDWRGRNGEDPAASQIGRRLAKCCVAAVALGVTGGLASWGLLLLLPSQAHYLAVFQRIPASRWWGIASEIVFYLVVMAVCGFAWDRWRRFRWVHSLLAIVAATTLASHFPPLFSRVSTLSTELAQPAALNPELFRTRYLFSDPETLARTIHHLLAAVSVVGILTAFLASGRARALRSTAAADNAAPNSFGLRVGILAARIALVATVAQLGVGVWVFVQLADSAQNQLLGGDGVAVALFILGLIMVLGLIQHLLTLALGELTRRKVVVTGLLLVLTTLFMTAMLHRVRTAVYRTFPAVEQAS